jgi:hypothetical protein
MKKAKEVKTGALIATAAAVFITAGCDEQPTKPQEYTGPPTEVTMRDYPKDLPYANAYQPSVVAGGGGGHDQLFFFGGGVDYIPYGGGGYAHPAMIGSARVTPYAGMSGAGPRVGALSSAGIRAYSPSSPGARMAGVSRGGFGGRAGSFSVGG